KAFAEAITGIKGSIHFCKICSNYADGEICDICRDPRRECGQICVVAEPRDMIAMEKTNEFRGLYHVLHGVISPLEGITPDKLKIRELQQRIGGPPAPN